MDDLGVKEKNSGAELVKILRVKCLFQFHTMYETAKLLIAWIQRKSLSNAWTVR